ncbi:MAG: 2-oxoacid:acceptor oxidoreductase family protein, partial [Candidatus Omnitrophota bacterium]
TQDRNLCFYLCGEGGQGLQSLADILMRAGGAKYIHNLPWYEPEVTKARTVAAVILSKHPYLNPNPQPGEVDVLLCMTPKMYREKKHFVRKGGIVLVDTLGQSEIQNGVQDYQLLNVPATQLAAEQLKERRSANIVLLGALNQTLKLFTDDAIEKAIRRTIPKIADINIKAYYLGKRCLSSQPT